MSLSMTPRQSAAVHLPCLDASHALLVDRFSAKLVHLVTPDGRWGREPDWLGWPSVKLSEMAPIPEPVSEHHGNHYTGKRR